MDRLNRVAKIGNMVLIPIIVVLSMLNKDYIKALIFTNIGIGLILLNR